MAGHERARLFDRISEQREEEKEEERKKELYSFLGKNKMSVCWVMS
jgi:hypothetical protein